MKFISKKFFAKILIENIWEPAHDCIGGIVELGLHFSSKLGGAKIRTFSEHFLSIIFIETSKSHIAQNIAFFDKLVGEISAIVEFVDHMVVFVIINFVKFVRIANFFNTFALQIAAFHFFKSGTIFGSFFALQKIRGLILRKAGQSRNRPEQNKRDS